MTRVALWWGRAGNDSCKWRLTVKNRAEENEPRFKSVGDEVTWDKACKLALSMEAASTEAKLLAGGNRDAQVNKVEPPHTTPRNRKRQLNGKGAKGQNTRFFLSSEFEAQDNGFRTGKTPAEMFLGRNIRSKIDLLPDDMNRVASKQEQLMAGKTVQRFQTGDVVWVRSYTGPKWKRGRIVTQIGPLSYEVDVGGNTLWSRHADQIILVSSAGGTNDPSNLSPMFPSDDSVTQDNDWQSAAEGSTASPVDSEAMGAPTLCQPDLRTPTKTGHTGEPGPVNEEAVEREQAGPAKGGGTPRRQRVGESPGRKMSPVQGGVRVGGQVSAEGGLSIGTGRPSEGEGPHEMRRRSTRRKKEPDRYQATM
ncbi:hypothetical protein O3P69_017420 [Scylla paramamosain]|uniref:Uncharacterized protein n=1 Tax=Scylla paramamosain TaxID=85552 RepID=A0AAW0TXF3_SCYPA